MNPREQDLRQALYDTEVTVTHVPNKLRWYLDCQRYHPLIGGCGFRFAISTLALAQAVVAIPLMLGRVYRHVDTHEPVEAMGL